jgi:hypothetical protein
MYSGWPSGHGVLEVAESVEVPGPYARFCIWTSEKVPPNRHSGKVVLLPSSGSTQVGTTFGIFFRSLIEVSGKLMGKVALQSRETLVFSKPAA